MAQHRGDSDPRFFAAFICAIGYSFLILAFYSVFWIGDPSQEAKRSSALWSLALIAVAVGFLFISMNTRKSETWQKITWGLGGINTGAKWAAFVAIMAMLILFAASKLGLDAANSDSEEVSKANHFALSIPSDVGEDGSIKKSATLFWTAPKLEEPADDGLLKMILAAGLTMAFGLVYPFVADSQRENEAGFIDKLVVPILSTLLFGVGAAEQVEAKDQKQDIRLISRGLAPIPDFSTASRELYLMQLNTMSFESRAMLQSSIVNLMNKLEISDGGPSDFKLNPDDRKALNTALRNLGKDIVDSRGVASEELRNQVKVLNARLETAKTEQNTALAKLRTAMLENEGTLADRIGNLDGTQRALACQLAQAEVANSKLRTDVSLRFQEQDIKDKRHLIDAIVVGLFGEDQTDLANFREDLSSQAETHAGLLSLAENCDIQLSEAES